MLEKICAMQSKLACDNQKSVVGKQNSNSDILDNFMSGLTDQKMDNITKRKIMVSNINMFYVFKMDTNIFFMFSLKLSNSKKM